MTGSAANPESRDSGFLAARCPGMTVSYFCCSVAASDGAGTLLEGEATGEDGKGGVTWATCALPATIRASETPDMASPTATSAVASSISRR
jgi:hypothetical protein